MRLTRGLKAQHLQHWMARRQGKRRSPTYSKYGDSHHPLGRRKRAGRRGGGVGVGRRGEGERGKIAYLVQILQQAVDGPEGEPDGRQPLAVHAGPCSTGIAEAAVCRVGRCGGPIVDAGSEAVAQASDASKPPGVPPSKPEVPGSARLGLLTRFPPALGPALPGGARLARRQPHLRAAPRGGSARLRLRPD